jgi:hypothetical protein
VRGNETLTKGYKCEISEIDASESKTISVRKIEEGSIQVGYKRWIDIVDTSSVVLVSFFTTQ